jgi:uncharacterized protein YbbK (DUF523 family)
MTSCCAGKEPILVSACLLGLPTRYDGSAKGSSHVRSYLDRHNLLPIPVCPEQLAGMSTPRPKTCFQTGDGQAVLAGTGRVIASSGDDMNAIFRRGAQMVHRIAILCGCRRALLKERSPSCGVHQVYCGDRKVPGVGVTTALLLQQGLDVCSEEDLSTKP